MKNQQSESNPTKMRNTMKKKLLFSMLALVGMMSATPSFAVDCGVMSVVSVASYEAITSGGQVWLRNDSGVACGSVAAGGQKLFNLPSATADKTMALILTAISLDKKMWVSFDDSTNPGMVLIMSMQK